jgi:hypothetical protein
VRRFVVYVYCALLRNSLSAVAKNEADKKRIRELESISQQIHKA